MRSRGWMLSTMLLLALAPRLALAGEADQTKWNLAMFTWVQRVPAEPGAPANAHPATLSEETLQSTLAPVLAKVEEKNIFLFGKNELKDLSKALSEAFALAQPGEDLILVSTNRHGGGLLERPEGLTARLFVREGALNLIVHDSRLEFLDRYQVDNLQPKFVYGSRLKASTEMLQAPQATRLRGDWLALPLVAATVAAVKPAPAPLAAPIVAPVATPVVTPVAAPVVAPVVAPAVMPKAAPEPSPTPAKGAKDAAFYEAQAQRLKALKRLRDENLISEAEYQEKRQAILKAL
jgi:hypothetical protein